MPGPWLVSKSQHWDSSAATATFPVTCSITTSTHVILLMVLCMHLPLRTVAARRCSKPQGQGACARLDPHARRPDQWQRRHKAWFSCRERVICVCRPGHVAPQQLALGSGAECLVVRGQWDCSPARVSISISTAWFGTLGAQPEAERLGVILACTSTGHTILFHSFCLQSRRCLLGSILGQCSPFQDQHQHAATNCALSASNTPGVNTPHNKRLGLDPLHSEGRKAVFG